MKKAFAGIAVFVLAVAPALVGAISSAALPVKTETPHVFSWAGKSLYKPASYTIYNFAAIDYLLKIHWTSWTSTQAKANATYSTSNCTSTCAARNFHSYTATARLWYPTTTKYGDVFAELTVVWVQNKTTHSINFALPRQL